MQTYRYDYHPLQLLAAEVHALRRSMLVLAKEVFRGTGTDGIGFNWEVHFVMRYLWDGGPHTIPQLARTHKTTRQYISEVVNRLIEKGLVELSHNPRHKRSKLVCLTDEGRAFLQSTADKGKSICERIEDEFDLQKLKNAVEVVRHVRWVLDREKWRSSETSRRRREEVVK